MPQEEAQAGGDRREAPAGRRPVVAGPSGCGCDPRDQRDAVHLLPGGAGSFGGLKSDQVKRLKDLEKENERLRKAVSDLTLEKLILREAASGNF